MNKTAVFASTLTILILIIAITGIYSSRTLRKHSQVMTDYLLQLDSHTRQEDWESAEKLLPIIDTQWKKTSKVWAILMDHQEIDNVNLSLYKMIEYIRLADRNMALAQISTLYHSISHVPDKAAFSIENVL
jgi:hypothetical protein